jgi:MFS family permease
MPLFKKGPINKFAFVNIVQLANAFIWYLLAYNMLQTLLEQINATSSESLLITALNTGGIALAGLLGSLFFDKNRDRWRFLVIWIAVGVALSLLPLSFNTSNITIIAVISVIFGVYFGLGMPATMGYHANVTKVDERGKISGFAFLIIGIVSSIAGLVFFESIIASCLLIAFVRLIGVVYFYYQGQNTVTSPTTTTKPKSLSYREILIDRHFIMYFIPWFMFTLINYMIVPIQKPIFEKQNLDYSTLVAVEYIITAVMAVISGFIADKLGRKRLAIIGFAMLGIGYAVVGVSPLSLLQYSGIFYIIADGTAWGIFYVIFIFTLWGDLAQGKHADKLYFLGALPFVCSYLIQGILSPLLTENFSGVLENPTIIFSFASVFLFLAVLPLIYAPETLPEKIMKDRDLKSYIETAKKKVAKETEKEEKHNPAESEPDESSEYEETGSEEIDQSYEDAKKLAEKYY